MTLDRGDGIYEVKDGVGRLHRWTCDPARGNLVMKYEVWARDETPADRPFRTATTTGVRQIDGKTWVPESFEVVGHIGFWNDDEPDVRINFELDSCEIVRLDEANQTLATIEWRDGMAVVIRAEDGSEKRVRVGETGETADLPRRE